MAVAEAEKKTGAAYIRLIKASVRRVYLHCMLQSANDYKSHL